jgi:hypothetical protein
MANFENSGNRWTMVFLRIERHGRGDYDYQKLPYELVRYNVDVTPTAEAVVVPDGIAAQRAQRIYEGIQFQDSPQPGDQVFNFVGNKIQG